MNKWFSLPRLGSEHFTELRRAKVLYDPKLGFKFTGDTDITRALETISSATNEEYTVLALCFICGFSMGENSSPGAVLCTSCAESENAYALYTMKFAGMMESL